MKETNLLLIALLAAIVLLVGCRESDDKESDAARKSDDDTFNLEMFNREWALWEAQAIANYAFTVEQELTEYPPHDFRACVTVANNAISGIEVLSLKDYLASFNPGEPGFEENIKRAETEYINYVESTVNQWEGGITGIYGWLSSSFLPTIKKLSEEGKARYNAQYHYLEYLDTGSKRFRGKEPEGIEGDGYYILKISDFQIAK